MKEEAMDSGYVYMDSGLVAHGSIKFSIWD